MGLGALSSFPTGDFSAELGEVTEGAGELEVGRLEASSAAIRREAAVEDSMPSLLAVAAPGGEVGSC